MLNRKPTKAFSSQKDEPPSSLGPSLISLRTPEEIKAINLLSKIDWGKNRYSAQHFHVGGSLTESLLVLIDAVKETEAFKPSSNWLSLFVDDSGKLKHPSFIKAIKSDKLKEKEFLDKFDYNEKCQSGPVGVGLSVLGGLITEWHCAGTYPLLENATSYTAEKFFYPQTLEPRLNPFKRMSIYSKSFKTELEDKIESASLDQLEKIKTEVRHYLEEIVLNSCKGVEIFNYYSKTYVDANGLNTESKAGLIFCFARDFSPKLNIFYGELLESIISDPRNDALTKNIVAFDFAGYESMMTFDEEDQVTMLQRLKEISNSLKLSWTFHLGETAESTSRGIRNVYQTITPQRIGHPLYQVYKSIKKGDSSLLEETAARGILAEICPAMNNTYDNLKALKEHNQRIKFKDLFDCLRKHSVKFSINPDSTFFNGYTVVQEIGFLLVNNVLSLEEIEQSLSDAVSFSFVKSDKMGHHA